MTYEQVARQFTDIHLHAGVGVYVVQGENVDTVALHIIPVAWFIAMKKLGRLYIGTYERPEHRIIGTKNFSFDEITHAFLKEEVSNALADQVGHMLDPQALKELLSKLPVSRKA